MKVKVTKKGDGLRSRGIGVLVLGKILDIPDAVAKEFAARGLVTLVDEDEPKIMISTESSKGGSK